MKICTNHCTSSVKTQRSFLLHQLLAFSRRGISSINSAAVSGSVKPVRLYKYENIKSFKKWFVCSLPGNVAPLCRYGVPAKNINSQKPSKNFIWVKIGSEKSENVPEKKLRQGHTYLGCHVTTKWLICHETVKTSPCSSISYFPLFSRNFLKITPKKYGRKLYGKNWFHLGFIIVSG